MPHSQLTTLLQDDLTALELRFLADGVFRGANIAFHSGDGDGGWAMGEVVEPYVRETHGRLWVPKDQTEPSRPELSWQVEFENGWAPVDLRHERRVETQAGHGSGSWTVVDEDAA